MFWRIYFVLNIILLGLVMLTVLIIKTGVVEKLSVLAGFISIVGLYAYTFRKITLPIWFWLLGLIYLLIVSFAANIYVLIPQYPDMAAWEPFLYFMLIVFNFPTYFVFYKESLKTFD